MTREEAIEMWVIPALKNTWNEKKCDEILKALEEEPCEELDFVQPHKKVSVNLNIEEPCEDAISREKTMQIVRKWFDRNAVPSDLKNEIEQLPPVQPKQTKSCYKMCDRWQRIGQWKPYDGSWYECSECGATREAVGYFENFCPNCGCKMASPTGAEGSDKE